MGYACPGHGQRLAVTLLRPAALWAASPFLAGWLLSPVVAYWVSRPRAVRELTLGEVERRRCAGSRERPGISSRRLSAKRIAGCRRTIIRRFPMAALPTALRRPIRGCCCSRRWPRTTWISQPQPVLRAARQDPALVRPDGKALGTFLQLVRDASLLPLPPAYISTVDSGNLLACLLTLKQGLLEKTHQPVFGPAVAAGLADTFWLIDESLRRDAGRLEQILGERPRSAGMERLA